ncbi:hypothetical protein [Streptomyces sp. NBC_01012]|uniref:hypothetical protein n=1 Tax=Streptomyces sp. NBC_01012 TaxID=2903717 RepID=UPI00386ACCE1|nr:hypothetical protein OG623_11135 [Streptomyces sp. NBC_01012]
MTAADVLLSRALVEEATKKSGLIWVRGTGPSRALWHVWHEGAAVLVGDGPGEQPLPPGVDAGAVAEVTVRSKDKGGRLVVWSAAVEVLDPHSEAWEAAVGELRGKRLNAPDADLMTERWARECRIVRLTPGESRTDLPGTSQAAPPLPTGATTRQTAPPALPRLLLKRRGRR